MAPLIPDGIYRIRNGQFTRFVADLVHGIPIGPILAVSENIDNWDQEWKIKNHGNGGNQITIESVAAPGSFAHADQFQGASLSGSTDRTLWTVVKVDGGRYYLQSPDANYVWELPQGEEFEKIQLVRHTGKDNTKWTFPRVKH